MRTKILTITLLFHFPLLTLMAQVEQCIVGSIQWSDTTTDVLDPGGQEAIPKRIKMAYIPELQANISSFDSVGISDFVKKIDKKVPSLLKWKTYRDIKCDIEFNYPSNYNIHVLRLPKDDCYGIALTKNSTKLKSNSSINDIEKHSNLGIYFTNLSFFDEISQLGLNVSKESDFYRKTMAVPVYLKAKYFKALYWQNQGRDSDGEGSSWATEDEMFLIMIEGPSGTSVKFNCGIDIINLMIASTFKFI